MLRANLPDTGLAPHHDAKKRSCAAETGALRRNPRFHTAGSVPDGRTHDVGGVGYQSALVSTQSSAAAKAER